MTDKTGPRGGMGDALEVDWYHTLFEESLLPSWICDAETMAILDVNRAAVERYGYSREEFLALRVTDLLRPEDVPALLDASARQVAHFDRGMWQHRTRAGVYITVDVCTHQLPTDARRAMHMIIHEPVTPKGEPTRNVKEFRDAEERFHIIADHLDTVFWISQPGQGPMLYLSPAFERIWGFPREEIYHNPLAWMQAVHPEDRARLKEEMQVRREAKVRTPAPQEYRIVRPDGAIRWIRARIFPVFSTDTTPDRIVGMAEDITEAREAADEAAHSTRQLRESERRYRALFHQSLAGVYRTTIDGIMLDCNDALVSILGYDSREDIMRHRAEDFYPSPGDRERFLEALRKHGSLTTFEMQLRRRDGRIIWALANVTLGDHDIIQGTMLDISARMEMKAALEKSEELLRHMVESSDDLILMQDPFGKYIYAKPSPHYGISPGSIIGKTPFDLFPQDVAQEIMHCVAEVVRTRRLNVSEDHMVWLGEDLVFHSQRSPICDRTGDVTSVVTFSRNITALKRAEKELRENREAIRLQELRMQIAADLHDEIGSTLSSTTIFNSLLRSQLPPGSERAGSMLDRIDDNLRDVQESLHEIVWAINPDNDDLGSIMLRMQEFAVQVMEARGINVHLEAPDSPVPKKVQMKIRRDIYLIFKEAVTNAAVHSECTEASVRLAFEEGVLEVTVTDNGRGIPSTERNRGNGLANMAARSRVVGGTLEITSKPGSGTSVSLRVPIA